MRAAPRTTAPNPEADVYVLADGVVHPLVVGEASRLKRSVAPASLLAGTEESRAFLLAFQDDPSRHQLALEWDVLCTLVWGFATSYRQESERLCDQLALEVGRLVYLG